MNKIRTGPLNNRSNSFAGIMNRLRNQVGLANDVQFDGFHFLGILQLNS